MHVHPVFFAIALASAAAIAQADFVKIDATAAYAANNYDGRPASKAIDGSGLNTETGTHSVTATDMWMGKNSGSIPGWFTVDLGAVYPLSRIKIWNFNMNNGSSYSVRGLKSVDIYVSTSSSLAPNTAPDYSDSATWTLVKAGHTIAQAPGNASYTGDEPLDFDPVDARYVSFKINSAYKTDYGGLSEVQFFQNLGAAASVSGVSNISAGGATLSGQLTTSAPDAAYPVRVVYDANPESDDPATWTGSTEATTCAAGDLTVSLAGLLPDTEYHAAFCIDQGGGSLAYSGVAKFYTGAVSVAVPADVSECDPSAKAIVFTRSADGSAAAMAFSYALSGTAVAGTDYAALSGTAEFAAGESSVSVPFNVLDNDSEDGDRTVTVTIAPGAYISGATASFQILDDESDSPAVCEWTGAGDGTTWEDPDNWSGHAVPRIMDTARFASHVYSGNTVTIASEQAVRLLEIDGAPAFTLATNTAAEGPATLAVGGISRASEGNVVHTLAVPVGIFAASGTNCVWDIEGAGSVAFQAPFWKFASGTAVVWKTGDGGVRLLGKNVVYNGPWVILEGALEAAADTSIKGTIHVGGGDTPATLLQTAEQALGSSVAWVYTNGTFRGTKKIDSGRLSEIHVYDGGYVSANSYFVCKVYLRGSTLDGNRFWSGGYTQTVTAYQSDVMSVFNCSMDMSTYYDGTLSVSDGSRPVDLWIKSGFYSSVNEKTVTKKGDGTLRTTSNMTGFGHRVVLSAGTWLVDNSESSGTGKNSLRVDAGATLGGTGFIGGTAAAANVSAAGSASAPAVVAPGSVDPDSGAAVHGTLTVGSTNQANNATLGDYSKLRVALAPLCTNDCLRVFGALSISQTGTTLEVEVPQDLSTVRHGDYVVASATDGITGSFATLALGSPRLRVVATTTEIIVQVPPPSTVILLL